jgi:arginine N-succinyltransferase
MTQGPSADGFRYEIRAGTAEHHADLCELARHLDTVNLPNDPAAISQLLDVSERSFSGEISDPRMREYVFVLWDHQRQRAVGTSTLIAQLGRRGVPYIYLEVRNEEKYSATLDLHFNHRVLTTRYSYDGPTEIGGLVMHPDSRRAPERLGSLISYVRFMFIALQRADFRDQVLAELLPPFEPDGTSFLWEAYGRRFTGLTYREADRLSKSNKEFVRSLFPEEIYATLLSPDAQALIGQVGPETRGVEKMLRRVGFEYAERVDPFDGGPHFICATDRISLVNSARAVRIGDPAPEPGRALLAVRTSARPYFRAAPVGEISAGVTKIPPALGRFLGLSDRDEAFWMPLPGL